MESSYAQWRAAAIVGARNLGSREGGRGLGVGRILLGEIVGPHKGRIAGRFHHPTTLGHGEDAHSYLRHGAGESERQQCLARLAVGKRYMFQAIIGHRAVFMR